VEDALARFGPHIADDPIALHAGIARDLSQRTEQRRQQVAVRIGQVVNRWDVSARNGQHVRGRARVDVSEYDHPLVRVDLVGRDLAGCDPAEQAFRVISEVALGHAWRLGESPVPDKTSRSTRQATTVRSARLLP